MTSRIQSRIWRFASLVSRTCGHIVRSPRAFIANLENYLARQSDPISIPQEAAAPDDSSLASQTPLVLSDSLASATIHPLRVNLAIDSTLANTPFLNVLIPVIAMRAMSGGPNTAINLTYRLAEHGIPIRYISTDAAMDQNLEPLRQHFSSLTGVKRRYPDVDIVCGSNPAQKAAIGVNDVFFGTSWWTVQMIKGALPLIQKKKFIYLIQDFEPGLYPWSTEYALALEPYGLNFHAIINESLLAEYLCRNAVGQFANPEFIRECAIFEPAVDTRKFSPDLVSTSSRKRKLLFYTRPKAPRNLYEMGVLALKKAVERGAFLAEEWDLFSIGEEVPPVDLGLGMVLQPHQWLDYEGYAKLLRTSDVGLSLMLSPHTSYPPLEMAASGMIVVTNTFGVKTESRLQRLSANILPTYPTLEAVVEGLVLASNRASDYGSRVANSTIQEPLSWDESFAHVVPRVIQMYNDCLNNP
jgi:O-antigen biosynthesis protein